MTNNVINTLNCVLQIKSSSSSSVITCNTIIPDDDTIPENTEGTEVITNSITPRYSDSILEIVFSCQATADFSNGSICIALFQDSTVNAICSSFWFSGSVIGEGFSGFLKYNIISGSTSPTTFKIRIGPSSDIVYVNGDESGNRLMGGVSQCNLIITEYNG